jgi:hypothetical protein
MSRSRMFGDDPPENAANPSPRTTIVGGRPPEQNTNPFPVPTGIQRLLRLAAVDPAFRQELISRRAGMAEPAGVTLTASEKAILDSIPAEQLAVMAESLPPEPEPRRDFLRKTAASAVVLLGGVALSSCDSCAGKGASPPASEQPPERENKMYRTRGLQDIAPQERAEHNEVPSTGGARPDEPPQRPTQVPSPPGGARPDVPPPPPPADGGGFATPPPGWDGGAPPPDEPPPPRPDKPSPTRGIQPGIKSFGHDTKTE